MSCKKHSTYKVARQPRSACASCIAMWRATLDSPCERPACVKPAGGKSGRGMYCTADCYAKHRIEKSAQRNVCPGLPGDQEPCGNRRYRGAKICKDCDGRRNANMRNDSATTPAEPRALNPEEDVRLARAIGERDRLRRAYKLAIKDEEDELRVLAMFRKSVHAFPAIPASVFTAPCKRRVKAPGMETPTLLLGDLHLGEHVSRTETFGINAYDFTIFQERMELLEERVLDLLMNHQSGNFEELVITGIGDYVSGIIHDELVKGNAQHICDQVYLGAVVLALFLYRLLRLGPCPKMRFMGISGNHGRLAKGKPEFKQYYKNFDYMFLSIVATLLRGVPEISITIPQCTFEVITIAENRVLVSHGSEVKSPMGLPAYGINRMMGNFQEFLAGAGEARYDYWFMGHIHRPMVIDNVIVNGCFPPGERVTIADGTRVPIESLSVGDSVLSHDGRIHPITETFERPYDGDLVKVSLGSGASEVNCTVEHPILAVKAQALETDPTPEWIPAKYLSPGDYVQVTAADEGDDTLPLDWCRMLGLYLAEGSASGAGGKLHHVDFTFHIDETGYSSFVAKVCRERWGSGVESERENRTTRTVTVNRKVAAEEIVRLCGKGAGGKRLAPELMRLSLECQYEILIGWLQGDGSVSHATGEKAGRVVVGTSVSRELIEQMHFIATRAGLQPRLWKLLPGENGPRKRIAWTLGFAADAAASLSGRLGFQLGEGSSDNPRKHPRLSRQIGDQSFYRVAKVTRSHYEGPVHNLEVNGAHSYQVTGVAVHNCMSGITEYKLGHFKPIKPEQKLVGMHPRHGLSWSYNIKLQDTEPAKIYRFEHDMGAMDALDLFETGMGETDA